MFSKPTSIKIKQHEVKHLIFFLRLSYSQQDQAFNTSSSTIMIPIPLILASGAVGFVGVLLVRTFSFPSKQVKLASQTYDTSFIEENQDRLVENLQEVVRCNTTSRVRGDMNYEEILKVHLYIQKGNT